MEGDARGFSHGDRDPDRVCVTQVTGRKVGEGESTSTVVRGYELYSYF